MPFWFWKDQLSETEILRQIAAFKAHGVFGFVIHPRVGLPREMKVILYDGEAGSKSNRRMRASA